MGLSVRPLPLLIMALSLALVGCQQLPQEPPTGDPEDFGTSTDTESLPPSGGGEDSEPVYDCDPVLQDCEQSGEKCTPVSQGGAQNHYTCVEDEGELAPLEACTPAPTTGKDRCLAGLVCLDGRVDVNQGGLCFPMCTSDSQCDAGTCIESDAEQITHCAAQCDPLAPSCTAPLQCRRRQDEFACEFASDQDDGGVGAGCSDQDSGCSEGLVCINGPLVPGCELPACCTPVCDTSQTSADQTCASALDSTSATCQPLFSDPKPGFETIGACFVPA